MNRQIIAALVLAWVAVLASFASAAAEKGWFGLAFNIETEGFSFNPSVRSVKIEKVVPSSPAAGAGLEAGDVVIQVQDVVIAGAKADDLKAAMKKSAGETLRLRIKRGAAEPYEVPLVAVVKPSGG